MKADFTSLLIFFVLIFMWLKSSLGPAAGCAQVNSAAPPWSLHRTSLRSGLCVDVAGF